MDEGKIARLLLQLPPTSRTMVRHQADLAWDTQTNFLRSIEHSLRVLAWQQTKDGQSKNPSRTPKIIPAPWEERQKLEEAVGHKVTDKVLGRNKVLGILSKPRTQTETRTIED